MTATMIENSVTSDSMSPEACAKELAAAVQERLERRPLWTATYRLQFQSSKFGFKNAADIVDYLQELGVSHIYASPWLQTREGSTHGYDVVDHRRLNTELGSEQDYEEFVRSVKRAGLGQLLDIVPNHMSVATDENTWWMDVLKHGPASRYASYFDIDWQPVNRELEEKVLLPILDDFSGNVLEAGRLSVNYENGAFFVTFEGQRFPLDPRTWPAIIAPGLDELAADLGEEHPHLLELQSILLALEHLPERSHTAAEKIAERYHETLVIEGRLDNLTQQDEHIKAHLARNLDVLNGTVGEPDSFDGLDRLLNDQAYQLVHWKAGSDELNYRRFFDITELAAVCMENAAVFEDTHRLVLDLATQQQIDAFRIDHIDGLYDPSQYLWRLQWEYVRSLGRTEHERRASADESDPPWSEVEPEFLEQMHALIGGPPPAPLFVDEERGHLTFKELPNRESRIHLPLFVTVEKILGTHESLPAEWPVQGTTGYDFLNQLNGLFVDGRGLAQLERYYSRFTDQRVDPREVIYQCKRLILDGAMQSELQLLAHRLNRLSFQHRRSRDYTLLALRSALREIMAAFPVYRTYIRADGVPDRDRSLIHLAVAQARRRNPSIDASVFEFIRDVLLMEQPPDLDEGGETQRAFFIGRFQQVTSPVWARAVEDTAFYRRVPLLSINEVGNDWEGMLTTVEQFHEHNQTRLRHWPRTMLASTTHDTKRSEDVRARINVLSEMPGAWQRAVQSWARINRRFRREVDGLPAPSRNDEWLFYQTLVGVWPLRPLSEEERSVWVSRLQNYMEKATREAKLRTSWMNPNPAYDAAMREFVANVLDEKSTRFLEDFQAFHESIVDSGLYSALSQTLLRLTSAGLPDVYQGQEIWDFSLVDPDNRRPIDFAHRRRLFEELRRETASAEHRAALARTLAQNPRDERTKLLVTWTALQFRRSWTNLEECEYVPLAVEGSHAEHVCAFAWRERAQPGRSAVIVAPRLIATLMQSQSMSTGAPCGADVWGDTQIVVDGDDNGSLHELMTGRRISPVNGRLPLGTILAEFPVALAVTDNINRHPGEFA